MNYCPNNCGSPVHESLQRVTFAAGTSMVHTVEMLIEAKWCDKPDCFQEISLRNYHDHRTSTFVDQMLYARNALRPIADGEIERGHALSQYDPSPGKRKTKLKDARGIAKRVIEKMNLAINKFLENQP